MIQIKSKYTGNDNSIYLVFIGDLHIGNKNFNKKYLDDALKFVLKNRDRSRILLMGDIIELATKSSVGRSVYDEDFPAYKQFEYAVNLFKPYADLIDVVIEGNHEERIIRDTSFEIVQEFCHRLNIYDSYGKFSAVVNYNMGDLMYSVNVWHGSGTGTTEASAINQLLKMRNNCMAHIYAMGHTHKLLNFNRNIKIPKPDGRDLVELSQLFINTGTALDSGGYDEQKGYPLNARGFGAVEIFSHKRKIVFHKISDLIGVD